MQFNLRSSRRTEVITIDSSASDDEVEGPRQAAAASRARPATTIIELEDDLEDDAGKDGKQETEAAEKSDGASNCIICLDQLGERGPHRAACLNCGHIFGKSCILQWLGEKKKCPQCNKRAKREDVIDLFNLCTVQSGDPAQLCDLEARLKRESDARAQAQREKEELLKELALMKRKAQLQQQEELRKEQHRSRLFQQQMQKQQEELTREQHRVRALQQEQRLQQQLMRQPPMHGGGQGSSREGPYPNKELGPRQDRAEVGRLQPLPLVNQHTGTYAYPEALLKWRMPQHQNGARSWPLNQDPATHHNATDPTCIQALSCRQAPPCAAGAIRAPTGAYPREGDSALQPILLEPCSQQPTSLSHRLQLQAPLDPPYQAGSRHHQHPLARPQQPPLSGGPPGQIASATPPPVMQAHPVQPEAASSMGPSGVQSVKRSREDFVNPSPSGARRKYQAEASSNPGSSLSGFNGQAPSSHPSSSMPPPDAPHLQAFCREEYHAETHGPQPQQKTQQPQQQIQQQIQHMEAGTSVGDRGPSAYPSYALDEIQPLPPLPAPAHSLHVFIQTQQYCVNNMRCFAMDVASAMLLMPTEEVMGCRGSRWILRKASMLCPEASAKVLLPGNTGMVRDVRYCARQRLAAVATQGAGLLLVSTSSESVVASYDLGSPVWSCSWSKRSPHLMYAGLQDGRLVSMDMRSVSGTAGRSAVLELGRAGYEGNSRMPLHTVEALGAFTRDADPSEEVDIECVAASAGAGVWGLSSAGNQSGLQPMLPLAVPRFRGFTCESLVCDHASETIAVSWRPPPPSSGVGTSSDVHQEAYHSILQREDISVGELERPDAARAHGGPEQSSPSTQANVQRQPVASGNTHKEVCQLSGHTSCQVMTRGAFVAPPSRLAASSGHKGWFASADEGSKQPLLWCLGSGAVVQRLAAHPGPVTQLVVGSSSDMGTILGSCCSSRLMLHHMAI